MLRVIRDMRTKDLITAHEMEDPKEKRRENRVFAKKTNTVFPLVVG